MTRQHHDCPPAVYHPGKGWKAGPCPTCEPAPAPQAPSFLALDRNAFYTKGKTPALFVPAEPDPSCTPSLFDLEA